MSCAVKTPTSGFPSKSVSMYSAFTNQAEDQTIERAGNKRHFRSRIHPVSRLCSKSVSSDEEEEDMLDKDSGYRSAAGSRSIPSSQSQVCLHILLFVSHSSCFISILFNAKMCVPIFMIVLQ